MALYKVEGPDKFLYEFEGPDDAPVEQRLAYANELHQKRLATIKEHQARTGFISSVKAGAREALAGTEEALGFDQAAEEQRQKAAKTHEGTTQEDIERAKAKGILPTAGAYLEKYIAEPLGGMVGRFGAPIAAGMAAPFVAPEAALGLLGEAGVTAAGVALTDFLPEMGENVKAQKDAGKDPNYVTAALVGGVQASIAALGVPGTGQINKLVGPKLVQEAKLLAPEIVEGKLTLDAAKKELTGKWTQYAQNMGVNTISNTGLMAGTEELRRAQAGQDLMSGKELAETAGQALLLSPIFGAMNLKGPRAQAETILEAGKVKYDKIQDQLGSLRELAQTRELTRQENIKIAELQQQARDIQAEMEKVKEANQSNAAANKAYEAQQANYRIPLKDQLELPLGETPEDIKAKQLEGSKQADLFTEPAETPSPPKEPYTITNKLLTSLGIGRSAYPHDALVGFDANDATQNKIIRSVLDQHASRNGVSAITQAKIENFLNDTLPKTGEQNVTGQPELNLEGNRDGVSSPSVRGPKATTGIKQADVSAVESNRDVVRRSNAGEATQSLALNNQLKGEAPLGAYYDVADKAQKFQQQIPQEGSLKAKSLEYVKPEDKLTPTSFMDRLNHPDPNVRYDARVEFLKTLREQRNIERSKQESELEKNLPPVNELEKRAKYLSRNLEQMEDAPKWLVEDLKNATKSDIDIEDTILRGKEFLVNHRMENVVDKILKRKATPEEIAAFDKLQNSLFRYEPKKLGKNKESEFAKDPQAYNAMIDAFIEDYTGKREPLLPKSDDMYAKQPEAIVDTGRTKEAVEKEIINAVGPNGRRAMNRGDLKVISSKEIPKDATVPANSPAFYHKGVAHLIHDRLNEGEALGYLHHETGVHYGLEKMVGTDIYKDVLKRFEYLNGKDQRVTDAHAFVDRNYSELKPGSKMYQEEVLARLVESAPNHSLVRRIIAAVKNFLLRKGLIKADTLSVKDLHDLVSRSLRESLAGNLKGEAKEGTQFAVLGENFKRYKKTTEGITDNFGITISNNHAAILEPLVNKLKDWYKKPAATYATIKEDRSYAEIMQDAFDNQSINVPARSALGRVTNNALNKIDELLKNATDAEKRMAKSYVFVEAFDRATNARERTTQFAKKQPEPNAHFNDLFKKAGGNESTKDPGLFHTAYNNIKEINKDKTTFLQKTLDKAETMFFSSDAAFNNRIIRSMEKDGLSWDTMKNVMYQISTSQALHREALAHQFIEHGGIEYNTTEHKYVVTDSPHSWKKMVESLDEAAKLNGIPLAEMQKYAGQALIARRYGTVDGEFGNGIVAKNKIVEDHTRDLNVRNKQKDATEYYSANHKFVHLSEEEIAAGLKLFKELKGMDKVVEQWNKTRENTLKVMVDSGLYNEMDAKILLDAIEYVPFYRVEQLENRAGPKDFSRGIVDLARDKKFRGSEKEINNVFDNMERWVSYAIRKSVGNRAATDLVQAAMKHIPDEVRKVDKVNPARRENTTGIWVDGEVQHYEFDDPLFVHAFTGMEPIVIPALSTAAKFTNLLRKNIVLNPLFSIGQLSQDGFNAMITSGVKHPFAIPLEVFKEFVKTLSGTSKAHEELTARGATGTKDWSSAVSRIEAEMKSNLLETSNYQRIKGKLENFSMASDNAVRQAIYNRTLLETGGKKVNGRIEGGDKALAVERAFEVINFRRSGASGSVNFLRQTVPFFGAYLQALNVTGKVLMGRGIGPAQKAEARKVLASTLFKVSIASLIYNMMISDDDGYKKLDPSVRDRRLIIPGTDGLSLPLRSDLFTFISKILPEHIYQMNLDQGAEDGTKAAHALKMGLINAIASPNVMPQAIKPIFEVSLNKDFYTGRDIVGQGIAERNIEDQYTPNTSELAKALGSTGMMSPMKVDYILKAYFGYTAGLGLMAVDRVISASEDKSPPEKSFRDTIASVPGASAFVSHEFGNKDVTDFYELRDLVNTAVNSYNFKKSYGTSEETKNFREENKDILRVQAQVNNINRNLTTIRHQETKIMEAPNSKMSPEEKSIKIRELRLRKQKMLANIDEIRKRAGL